MNHARLQRIACLLLALAPCLAQAADDWTAYGRTLAGTRYSPAAQITPANVDQLEVAWTLRTGDDSTQRADPRNLPAFEATPLKVGDTLYLCTPRNYVIAVDAETGKERWRYDPKTDTTGHFLMTCRGVAYHEAPAGTKECPRRIFTTTLDARLIALDAATGKPCAGFGTNGTVSLLDKQGEIQSGYYAVTSAPTVIGDRVISGGLVLDNMSSDVPSGVVRAFDALSGKLSWAWNPGAGTPQATAAEAVYGRGSPNAWSQFSADPALGLVYIPTGNRSPDYWGVNRSEIEDKYSSATVALDAATGDVRWVFQTVHHDLWDYDVGSQPVLTDFPTAAGPVPALIQATKTGQVYVLDRRTGTPLTKVEEKPVPQQGVPGERLSPTQPFSVGMPSLHPLTLVEDDIWGLTPIDRHLCVEQFRKYRHEGIFTPPSLQGSVSYPSNMGASSWGSIAIDERQQILLANTSRVASIAKLVPRTDADAREKAGEILYMPARKTPYAVEVTPFLSPLGIPCTPPPWGVMTAIDLKTQKVLWEKPLGTTRDLAPLGISLEYGVPNTGGSIATAGGLTFIAATTDRYFRAFDTRSGEERWRASLPAGGQATPMTYVSDSSGRQFVVIAAGGHAYLGSKLGDYLIAYALPKP